MLRVALLLLVCIHTIAYSQGVGLGTKIPNPSAVLDITAMDKGVLLPRIALKDSFDKTSIVDPEKSLLIWNSSLNKSKFPLGEGFYYNSSTKQFPVWVKLLNELNADRGVKVFSGQTLRLQDTVNGSGVKFQYVFDKAGALRCGQVNGTQWDIGSIGNASVAFGNNTQATGDFSFAAGNNSIATGTGSVAFAGGRANPTTGAQAFAFGSNSTANHQMAVAMGLGVNIQGYTAMGIGEGTFMNAKCGVVLGSYNDTTGYFKNAPLSFTKDKTVLFVLGNGQGINTRSDALKIYRDGSALLSGMYNYDKDYPYEALSLVPRKYVDEKVAFSEVFVVLDFPVTPAFSKTELSTAVPGALPGDFIELCVDADIKSNTVGEFSAWVIAAGTVQIRYYNYSNEVIDPINGKFKIRVKK